MSDLTDNKDETQLEGGAAGSEGADNQTGANVLEMSDEDFLKAGPPKVEAPAAKVEDPAGDKEDKGTGVDKDPDDKAKEGEAAGDETGGTPGEKQGGEQSTETNKEAPADKAKEPVEAAKDGESKETKDEAKQINYEAEYKKLLAPFKANGRDITVDSVEDAITLMQMGANYNKKMSALKPNLKLMKLLENNGFLSEDKIGFLIDLGKKDPAAINKLVKDAGIDPMDLDGEKASAYRVTTRTVDDKEIDLDTVLDDLQSSPSYTRTLDVVSTKWDAASKRAISDAPQLMRVINDHVERGIYDLIAKEVEKERMLGRLNGLSDIQAYHQVGDAINARGGFNHLSAPAAQKATETKTPVVVAPPTKVEDDKLKDKRRAASSTKPAASSSTPKDFNPLAMSDEEFSKQVHKKFL